MDSVQVCEHCDNNYNFIDLMKFIMAICVIAIHTGPLSKCENAIIVGTYDCIVRMAVPFFFICSGFFLNKKLILDKSEGHIVLDPLYSYLKRILKMYCLWTVLYLPLTIIGFVKWKASFVSAIIRFFINILFVGENYNSWSLWYLLSTVYALCFVICLLKRNVKIRNISLMGFAILVLSLFIDELMKSNVKLPEALRIIKLIIGNTIINGRIFRGLFYIPLGMFLAMIDIKSVKASAALLVVGLIANFFLSGILSEFALVISATGLFMLGISTKLPDSHVYLKLRILSTDLYVLHLMVWSLYYIVVYGETRFGFDSFFFTTFFSIIISLVLTCIRNRTIIKRKS